MHIVDGIFIYVDDEGNMGDTAFSKFQERYTSHPDTGVLFKGHKIPEVKDAIKVVETLQQQIPQIGLVSWDATIDKDGRVVIVEMNLKSQSIWFPQMASGKSAFGELTPEILKFIRG